MITARLGKSWFVVANSVQSTECHDLRSLRLLGLRLRGRYWLRAPFGRRERGDIDTYAHTMPASSDEHALNRADVVVVASPGDGDMVGGGYHVVGGIEINPPHFACVYGEPRMREISPYQPRFAWGWISS